MSKVKFQNYSGIKNAKDNPRCIADTDLQNGMSVVYYTDTAGTEHVKVAADDTEAKTVKHFVWNTIDKPELDNESDFIIKEGEYVRIFEFPEGEVVDISGDLITDVTVAIKDVVVPAADGKYSIAAAATGYAVALEVLDKTTFGGVGYSALVVTQ